MTLFIAPHTQTPPFLPPKDAPPLPPTPIEVNGILSIYFRGPWAPPLAFHSGGRPRQLQSRLLASRGRARRSSQGILVAAAESRTRKRTTQSPAHFPLPLQGQQSNTKRAHWLPGPAPLRLCPIGRRESGWALGQRHGGSANAAAGRGELGEAGAVQIGVRPSRLPPCWGERASVSPSPRPPPILSRALGGGILGPAGAG